MVRTLLLVTLVTVGCIQAPPMERYPVAVPDDTPPAGSSTAGSTAQDTTPPAGGAASTPSTAYPSAAYPEQPAARPGATEFGLVFGDDTAWLHTRTVIRSGTIVNTGFYFSEDDFIFDIGFLRMGQTQENSPISVGAGLGFYAGSLDDPLDYVSAIVLTGVAAYQLSTSFPSRLVGQLSYAPDVTTFGDGDSLTDLRAGFEVELGGAASVQLGYRFFQIGLDEFDDLKLEDGAYFGVRLGF